MSIDTTFARRCIRTLERALGQIAQHRGTDEFLYDVYRAACVRRIVWHSRTCSATRPNTA